MDEWGLSLDCLSNGFSSLVSFVVLHVDDCQPSLSPSLPPSLPKMAAELRERDQAQLVVAMEVCAAPRGPSVLYPMAAVCVCVCLLWGEVWGEVVCASLVKDSVDVYNAICTVAVCKNIIVCMRAS